MNSREAILTAVKKNQPAWRELPGDISGDVVGGATGNNADFENRFISVLESIGGAGLIVSGYGEIETILREQFSREQGHRIVTGCPELTGWAEAPDPDADAHTLENVELAILRAHFGVAENGACWITEDRMIHRALPFIAQHLALVIDRKDILADMHAAYERIAVINAGARTGIGTVDGEAVGYGFATFIAGPSKTADIEQSLVLGAHGPRSMTVFMLDE